MAEKKDAISEALIGAKLSLDEAVKKVQGGVSPVTAGQVDRLRAQDSLNTGCTNTGCGKPAAEQIASQPAVKA